MTKQVDACCTSPAAMCYWLTVSLIVWGVLNLIGLYWRPLHASSAFACLFAMAIGCFANWLRNRSFHCAITGPLFLLAGVVLLLSDLAWSASPPLWVWPLVLVGTGIAFLLEWGYAKRRASVPPPERIRAAVREARGRNNIHDHYKSFAIDSGLGRAGCPPVGDLPASGRPVLFRRTANNPV